MRARSLFLASVVLLPPAAVVAGCSVEVTGPAPDAHSTVGGQYAPDAASEAAATSAPDAAAPPYEGSPLCNASHSGYGACYPDDPTICETDAEALACRLQPLANGAVSVQPACAQAGSGMAGAACKASSDCAAGFECVVNGSTTTCQHYCCAGNVHCSKTEFCDIQPMAASNATKVPVCMPIVPAAGCQLLQPGSCPAESNTTCAVVREDGATSCVDIGPAKAMESCDTAHCGKDLVCLGIPGQRLCYQLCHTATSAECSATAHQTCKGGLPLFPDPSVGICQ